MAGVPLLTDDIIKSFPQAAQISGDPEWTSLALLIQNYRDELVRSPTANNHCIEEFDDFHYPEKIPRDFLLHAAESWQARIDSSMTERQIRQAIANAVVEARMHCTIDQIEAYATAITGNPATIIWTGSISPGWDQDDSIAPPTYEIDYAGGIIWDQDDTNTLGAGGFVWQVIREGLLLDIGNFVYTVDQLNAIYEMVAFFKESHISIAVGYIV